MHQTKITLRGIEYNIQFIHVQDRIIKCIINDGNRKYTGLSRLNKEAGDEYNKLFGEMLSLSKALGKIESHKHKAKVKFIDKHTRNMIDDTDSIVRRCVKLWTKEGSMTTSTKKLITDGNGMQEFIDKYYPEDMAVAIHG